MAGFLSQAFKPRAYSELIAGKTIAQAGCEPILHMRHFQTNKCFSDALVADMQMRNKV
jgi:quinolinate synthase